VSGASKGGGKGSGGGKGAGGKGSSGRGYGGRELGVRLKTARGRTHSSQLWLERQLNDPYVARAKREGFRSRAVYKLQEIDDKARLLKPGQRVLDLGAAPGGWSQLAADRTRATEGKGRVVAIDLLPVDPIPGVDFIQMDFMADEAPETLKAMLGGPADLVLSDMAANTVGHRQTDHLRIVALVEAAAHFAVEVLAPGGAFLAKVFQGGTEGEVLALLKQSFAAVRHLKPGASRAGSSEIYVLATGFKGRREPG
jgi:23S rRNA (uridine2552-2'-O)-methyltransferase